MSDTGPYRTNHRVYIEFMGTFLDECKYLEPSLTHFFLYYVAQENPRALWHTMNIDGLEEYFGLNDNPKDRKNCQVQVLHGSLRYGMCYRCWYTFEIDDVKLEQYKKGMNPPCPDCHANNKREPGYLRPDVQLYGQTNRFFGHFAARERHLGAPSIILVLGTSLGSDDGVSHLKKWREMNPNAPVIYVDRDPKPAAEIKHLFDYHLVMDCDLLIDKVANLAGIDLFSYAAPVHQRILQEQDNNLSDHIKHQLEQMSENQFKKCLSFFRKT